MNINQKQKSSLSLAETIKSKFLKQINFFYILLEDIGYLLSGNIAIISTTAINTKPNKHLLNKNNNIKKYMFLNIQTANKNNYPSMF